MTLLQIAVFALGCALTHDPIITCTESEVSYFYSKKDDTIVDIKVPLFSQQAIDVVISAESALVWDVETGKILYQKEAEKQREVASISKLLSVLALRDALPLNKSVLITADILSAQRQGANIKLPVGEHASVTGLLSASLIASANDAMVALAVASHGSEKDFVDFANLFAGEKGLTNTKISNSTGLPGGEQYSTAFDVKELITLAYSDAVLRPYLSQAGGKLSTVEGSLREYKTTNKLTGTYLPILAGKTGYTDEAKQNLAIITKTQTGQEIGAIVLGSDDRFYDMKVLVEWINKHYTW